MTVPEAIPAERLKRYGLRPPKLARYPGLKEEYYLADFEPDHDRARRGRRRCAHARSSSSARRPTCPSTTGPRNELFPRTLDALGRRDDVHAVVLPRTAEQREQPAALALPSVIVAAHAVDAQSLIALADLVVSAGGTMNREAVALGVPVYTVFAGRLGGVDEELIRDRPPRHLRDPASS